jgi:AcrR family transcriptional regulator
MGRPKATEQKDTRRALLDAALELFAEGGFHGTGLRDIAGAAGVREAAIYHYFAGKEALFEALITEPPEDAEAHVGQFAAGPVPDDLQALFEPLVVGLLERVSRLRERKKFRLLMNDGMRLALEGKISFIDRAGGAARAELHRLMKRLVAEGRLRGDPEMLVMALIAPVMMWRQMQALGSTHRYAGDFRAFARDHVAVFLQGALERRAPPAPEKLNARSTVRPARGGKRKA